MPNDAKLGLVVGVGLVIAVAVVFYRKDGPTASPAAIDKVVPPLPAPSAKEATVAKATSGRRHTVREGETLAAVARQYLGDESRSSAIRALNPALGAEEPAVGTVLLIPGEEPTGP
jgi:hypothetical protein